MIVLDDRERHIVLYAKHWYQRSKDPIRDLKKIIGKFNAVQPSHLSTYDVYLIVLGVFLELVKPHKQKLFLEKIFKPPLFKKRKLLGARGFILEMISKLSNVLVENSEKGILLIDLGKPDPEVLPLKKA